MSHSCTLCPLHESALTVCVPGRGPDSAKIMLVGQAPGVKEDCSGEAFIGKSGHLLNEMLTAAGIDPAGVYLTNAVKCKPPVEKGTFSERAPLPAEIDACRVHLTQEIHRIKPDVIIALGDTALKALTRLTGISKRRGQAWPLHKMFAYDCDVWATWHPAYVLRVLMARATVTSDLQRVRDRGMEQSRISWRRTNASMALEDRYTALDIELIDEAGKIVAHPTQAAFYHDGEDTALVTPLPNAHNYYYSDKLVHHNGLEFDLPKLYVGPRGYDTMYLAHLVDETQPLGLESLCVKYLGVRGWKEDEYAPLGSDELCEYNARDAVYTLRLFHHLRELLGPRIKIYEQILLPGRRALNTCSQRGLWIDAAAVEQVRVQVDVEITRDRERVVALASEWVQIPKFNPNSTAHVAQVLIAMGHELERTRKSGKWKVDKGVLQGIESQFTLAMLSYKSATKRKSTYVVPYAKAAATGDNRMHNEYTMIRTSVGRTSARKTNVQNLDRELEFFSAPPGAVFVKADYSALHFRLAAWCADARSILDRYAADNAWDPHKFFASRFYGIPQEQVTKAQRQIAKSANFSQLYLGDGLTLQNYAYKMGIELPRELCDRLHAEWHATFPEFIPWYEQVWDEVSDQGYVETATGRRRNFGDVQLMNRNGRRSAHREAVNMKVLGLEPDLALSALIACHTEGLPINGFFHDAISFEFDNLQAYEYNKENITRCMIDRPLAVLREQFATDITVPIEIEFTVYQGDEHG